MITQDKLDKETLIFIIDILDYQFQCLKSMNEEDGIHQEDRIKYGQRLEGIRQAINKIEEYL